MDMEACDPSYYLPSRFNLLIYNLIINFRAASQGQQLAGELKSYRCTPQPSWPVLDSASQPLALVNWLQHAHIINKSMELTVVCVTCITLAWT